MDVRRRSWFLMGALAVSTLLLSIVLFGLWGARLQPASGQASLLGTGLQSGPLETSTKTYSPDTLYAGDTVTFAIALRNTSTATLGITVTDQLVAALEIVCGSEQVNPATGWPVCDAQQNVITYTAPITAHSVITLSFQAVISASLMPGQVITNTVWIDDGMHILTRSVTLTLADPTQYVYLPLVIRRWPPLPYPPTNPDVTPPNMQGNYTLSWDYIGFPDITAPTSYVLEEALDAVFSDPTVYEPGLNTSYSFTGKLPDMYYYRVRGQNSYGPGDWTYFPPVNVTREFFDDFSDPSSGWRTGEVERYNFWDPNHYGLEVVGNLNYVDGHYQIYVPRHRGSWPPGEVDTFWVWPAVAAPLPPDAYPLPDRYCVEVRAAFVNPSYWAGRWGVVFGANTNFDQLYAFNITDIQNRAMIYYQNYHFPGNSNYRHCDYQNDCAPNQKHYLLPWYQENYRDPAIHEGNAYNTLKIVVRGDWVYSYANGVLLDERAFSFPRDRIGLMGGSWEVTPIDLRIDYFHYQPYCPESLQ